MNSVTKLNKNQSGQAALEAAIILIAFVVVASVFAFAILSAGQSSTQKSEQAIYSGLSNVQSSMEIKGALIADTSGGSVSDVKFTVSPVNGGAPVNLDPASLVVSYRDASQAVSNITPTVTFLISQSPADNMLSSGEVAEITVDLSALSPALGTNTAFTIEVKPQTGGVLAISRTTPVALDTVTELR